MGWGHRVLVSFLLVGGLCINEFFMKKGWLTLKEEPTKIASLKEDQIDFSKTKCWEVLYESQAEGLG